jgi:hypothetical protein
MGACMIVPHRTPIHLALYLQPELSKAMRVNWDWSYFSGVTGRSQNIELQLRRLSVDVVFIFFVLQKESLKRRQLLKQNAVKGIIIGFM